MNELSNEVQDSSDQFYCKICDFHCASDDALEDHLNGNNHMKKFKKQLGKVQILLLKVFSKPHFLRPCSKAMHVKK